MCKAVAAAIAIGAAALGAAPAHAATSAASAPDEIRRVLAFREEFTSWQVKDVPAFECPDSHPWLVSENKTGSRVGSYYKGIEVIDAHNSVWVEMDASKRSYGGGYGEFITGWHAGGRFGNADPFISTAVEFWAYCTSNPDKFGYEPSDGVLRTPS
jgi:hypothetical protein